MRLIRALFLGYVVIVTVILVGANLGIFHQWLPAFFAASWFDKTVHFLSIVPGTILFNAVLRYRVIPVGNRQLLVGTLIVVVLVSIEECLQIYIPFRSFDLIDLFADFAGIALADYFVRHRLSLLKTVPAAAVMRILGTRT